MRRGTGRGLRAGMRNLWPDRHPLRRPVDRLQARLMAALAVAFLAAAGTRTGATLAIWTNRAGTPTRAPMPPAEVTHQAVLTGTLAVAVVALSFIVCALVIRRILDRRRMAAWDAEWSSAGPQWSNWR